MICNTNALSQMPSFLRGYIWTVPLLMTSIPQPRIRGEHWHKCFCRQMCCHVLLKCWDSNRVLTLARSCPDRTTATQSLTYHICRRQRHGASLQRVLSSTPRSRQKACFGSTTASPEVCDWPLEVTWAKVFILPTAYFVVSNEWLCISSSLR